MNIERIHEIIEMKIVNWEGFFPLPSFQISCILLELMNKTRVKMIEANKKPK